ncbi:unnamed protein product [Phytophthora fragariaefolia]|uniref:Unnamed protein product n=1 Tax=Phytophthora fragariaefolia TaxID=1490495 RepID=A0A9W7D1F5_9STRA|nr:unnamed protein product [Phytophthora fragariaefolia]
MSKLLHPHRGFVSQTQVNGLRTKIIEQFHDSSIVAHPGIRRRYLRIKQWYYWDLLHEDVEQIANYFFDNVVRHHGVPAVIISDHDPKFTARFWKSLAQVIGVQLNMTTSYRAQADGQTERQNRVLEDVLRCMVSYHGDDWAVKLGTIEYAMAR